MAQQRNKPEYMRLLDPDALAQVHRLSLIARGVVEGFVSGRHRSPYKGFSIEFAEHREYTAGDDLRNLDWRVLAKSDRYYIKQYIEETNLRSVILLDASASMGYVGKAAAKYEGKRLSKLEYAKYLAASLAHLMIHQQDAVGLVTFDKDIRRYIPPRSRVSHLKAILQELAATEPGQATAIAPILHDIADRAHRRGLMIVISDLFDDTEDLMKALYHFRYRKHEVLLLHVMAAEEVTFPFEAWSDFRDLEQLAGNVQLDPRTIRAEYLDQVRRFLEQLETGAGQMHVDYVQLTTRTPFGVALCEYLAKRRSRAKA